MTQIAFPIPRAAAIPIGAVSIPVGSLSNHVLGYPGGNVSEPDPFANGVAVDNRRFPHWEYHEPTQGDFHWADNFYDGAHGYYVNPDFAVTAWHGAGKKMCLCLQAESRPAWASLSNDTAWGNWVTAAVTRWNPEYIEFINEPSSLALDPAWVVGIYAIGYAAAKAVNPSIIVIGPSCESISTPGNGVEWTVDFLNAGGDAYIDALGIHLYPHGLANHEPRSIVDQMAWLHTNIDGLWSGPIYNTEAGCAPEIFDTQTLATQRRWFWKTNMLPILTGCTKSFWYAWGEDNYGPYQSAYLTEILALWTVIKSFEGHTAAWDVLPDGTLRVVRDDGLTVTY